MLDNRTVLSEDQIGHDFNNGKTAFGDDTLSFAKLPRAFGIQEAPVDGYSYSRRGGVWQRVVKAIYDEYTTTILHFDESATKDEMGNTWTPYGSPIIVASPAKFGKALSLNGSSSYLRTVHNSNTKLTVGDFTIDCWVYFRSLPGFSPVFNAYRNWGGNFDGFSVSQAASGNKIVLYASTDGTKWNISAGQSFGTLAVNTYYHVALVRDSSRLMAFLNGVKGLSISLPASSVLYPSNNNFEIGGWGWASTVKYYLNGCIDEFRISKGIARWTDNFTPPTQRYR